METMIVDGRAIAQDILDTVRGTLDGTPLLMRAIVMEPTGATQSYLRAKARAAEAAGIAFEAVTLPDNARTEEVIEAARAPGADAVIVQLPLPPHINTEAVLAAIPLQVDADALSPAARAAGVPVPPVAAAVEEILARSGVAVAGARAAVIGKGRLVGEPVATRLAALGASVESFDDRTFDPSALAAADIIVSGAGVAHLVTSDMIKDGAALIDAGTSEAPAADAAGARILGDIDPAAAAKASVYTPVPGGVGPVTVACLMRNAAQLRAGNIQVL